MINRHSLRLFALLAFIGAAHAAAPEVSLQIDSLPDGRHYGQAPLLVSISVGNPDARFAHRQNRRNTILRKRLKRQEAFSQLPAQLQQQVLGQLGDETLEPITLGTKSEPLSSLVRVELLDAGGKPIGINAVALADSKDEPGRVTLDAFRAAYLNYGLSVDQLRTLPPGEYRLQAILSTQGKTSMWQGEARSEMLTLEIKAGEPRQRPLQLAADYLTARYYLADDRLDLAEEYAKRLLKRSISAFRYRAHEILGDVALRRGDEEAALRAYDDALEAYGERIADLELEIKHAGVETGRQTIDRSRFEFELPQQLYTKRAYLRGELR